MEKPPINLMDDIADKQRVLRYMHEAWTNAEWAYFFFMPEALNPHDIRMIQLLRSSREDN